MLESIVYAYKTVFHIWRHIVTMFMFDFKIKKLDDLTLDLHTHVGISN